MNRPEKMTVCPECACFVRSADARCPHCSSSVMKKGLSLAAGALVVGLAFTGCGGSDPADTSATDTANTADTSTPVNDTNVAALYGVADTSSSQ